MGTRFVEDWTLTGRRGAGSRISGNLPDSMVSALHDFASAGTKSPRWGYRSGAISEYQQAAEMAARGGAATPPGGVVEVVGYADM